MKKRLLVALLAALMLTSCQTTKQEPPEDEYVVDWKEDLKAFSFVGSWLLGGYVVIALILFIGV